MADPLLSGDNFNVSVKKRIVGNVESRQKVYLWGNSVILASLRVSLQSCSQYEVITLVSPFPVSRELAALSPDIIFFDLEVTRPETVLPLLETSSDLVLIGVSPDRNLVRVWSGQQIQELSTRGLLEVINDLSSNSLAKKGLLDNRFLQSGTDFKDKD